MPAPARLLLPPSALAGCVFAAIERDTRGLGLSEKERFNYFPASPLIAISVVLEGALSFVKDDGAMQSVPQLSIAGAQNTPTTSWSEGDVHVLTIAMFPDAWALLSGEEPQAFQDQIRTDLPDFLGEMLVHEGNVDALWQQFCARLLPIWSAKQRQNAWPGKDRVKAWGTALLARALHSERGTSLRAVERRLRRWSGQSQQSLEFYARFEQLHQLSIEEKGAPLAAIAHDAGFADQSHMGRAVRRATGFSPAKLNQLIETEEAFWCYRLLGERY